MRRLTLQVGLVEEVLQRVVGIGWEEHEVVFTLEVVLLLEVTPRDLADLVLSEVTGLVISTKDREVPLALVADAERVAAHEEGQQEGGEV